MKTTRIITGTGKEIEVPVAPLQVNTPLGTLVAMETEETDHPGIQISLRKDASEKTLPLASVRYENDWDKNHTKDDLVVRVWKNVDQESCTHSFCFANVDIAENDKELMNKILFINSFSKAQIGYLSHISRLSPHSINGMMDCSMDIRTSKDSKITCTGRLWNVPTENSMYKYVDVFMKCPMNDAQKVAILHIFNDCYFSDAASSPGRTAEHVFVMQMILDQYFPVLLHYVDLSDEQIEELKKIINN